MGINSYFYLIHQFLTRLHRKNIEKMKGYLLLIFATVLMIKDGSCDNVFGKVLDLSGLREEYPEEYTTEDTDYNYEDDDDYTEDYTDIPEWFKGCNVTVAQDVIAEQCGCYDDYGNASLNATGCQLDSDGSSVFCKSDAEKSCRVAIDEVAYWYVIAKDNNDCDDVDYFEFYLKFYEDLADSCEICVARRKAMDKACVTTRGRKSRQSKRCEMKTKKYEECLMQFIMGDSFAFGK